MRILAIDDEQDILKLIEKALREQYQVDIVHVPMQNVPDDLSAKTLYHSRTTSQNSSTYT